MSRDKLRRVVALLHAEAQNPGSRSREIMARLHELAALYEHDCPAPRTTDPSLLRALEILHARPAEPWTVASLARAVGMSRAAFARKFTAAFAVPPVQYLHEERMERAALLLADAGRTLAAIAHEVGYQSEWAFRRAFKRHHGVAPGAFRRAITATTVTALTTGRIVRGSRPRMRMAA